MIKGEDLRNEWSAFMQEESEPSFFKIYTHYYHYLNYIGLKKGFSTVRVKDSINDVFLYIWEKRNSLHHINSYHNYIITSFLRKLYKAQKTDFVDITVNEKLSEFVVSPSVEELHIYRQSINDASNLLLTYIDQLPDKQRLLIYQKFYLGLSYQEIAKSNGISVNTVYNTIYKAIDKLKTLISKDQLGIISLGISLLTILFLFFFNNQ